MTKSNYQSITRSASPEASVNKYIVACSSCGLEKPRPNIRKFKCNPCKNHARPQPFYNNRKIVLKRDHYSCTSCGSGMRLVVHHIDENVQNNNLDNLITKCQSCHIHDHNTKDSSPIVARIVMEFGTRVIHKSKANSYSMYKPVQSLILGVC